MLRATGAHAISPGSGSGSLRLEATPVLVADADWDTYGALTLAGRVGAALAFTDVLRWVAEGSLPWQFPAGEVEASERAQDAAVWETPG